MSSPLTLTRQPGDFVWTSGSVNYTLFSIILDDENQFLVARLAGSSDPGDPFLPVATAEVDGGATYTTAFEALSDETTCIVFVYYSRITLPGEDSPGHTMYYIALANNLNVDIGNSNVLIYLDEQEVSRDLIRPAQSFQNSPVVEEQVVNPANESQTLTISRAITPYDKFVPMADDEPMPYVASGQDGAYFTLSEIEAEPPFSVSYPIQDVTGYQPVSLYTFPEDMIVNPRIMTLCWPPSGEGSPWVVTNNVAKRDTVHFQSITDTPPVENSYLALYAGRIPQDEEPVIPNDLGDPVTVATEDGIVVGLASAITNYPNFRNEFYPVIAFPPKEELSDINESMATLILNDENEDQRYQSYATLVPMRVVVPVTFTSDDGLFEPYLSSIVTLNVGEDTYPYDPELGGFVIDFTNDSTRDLISVTNLILSGTVSVNDEDNLLESVTVNGAASPYPAISIPLTSVPTITFAGSTKSGGGGGDTPRMSAALTALTLLMVLAAITGGVVLYRSSRN